MAAAQPRPGPHRSHRARRWRPGAVPGLRDRARPPRATPCSSARLTRRHTMAGHRKALIIAVDEYEHPGLRRLRSPDADAEALAAVLSDPRIGDFEVNVVRNQDAHEIESRIEDLFYEASADDLLLLHFSGHGL